MPATRSSMPLRHSLRPRSRPKDVVDLSDDEDAKHRRPSLPRKQHRDVKQSYKKRKCQSMPAQQKQTVKPKLEEDNDDILSVHSDEEEQTFNFNCNKCRKKFVKRAYFVAHLKLAHAIDLGPILRECGLARKSDEEEEKPKPIKSEPSLEDPGADSDVVVDDEDYYSCDSLVLDSDSCSKGSAAWDKESEMEIESVFDESLKCHHCDLVFEQQILMDAHSCILRNLSPEHRDIVKNQPFVELKRLRGAAKRNRKQTKSSVCPICSVRFATDVEMMIHAQMEHRVDPNLMKFASSNVPSNGDSKKFLPISKNGVYQRDSVRKSKAKKPDLSEVVSEKVVCHVCSKFCLSKSKLEAHMEKEHQNKGLTRQKYDHNNDPLAKAIWKRHRHLRRGEPKMRVKMLMNLMGLKFQNDVSKYV